MKIQLHKQVPKLFCLLLISTSLAVGTAVHGAETETNHTQSLFHAPARHPLSKPGDWQDPDLTLTELNYAGIPVAEVGTDLKKKFGNYFDVLFPIGSEVNNWDWRGTPIELQLKNVKASEVFNAMNLVFETGKTPLRWELMMNGQRPTALLHNLYEAKPGTDPATGLPAVPQPTPVEKPMVFFVGDLLGDAKSGGMTMEQLVKTVTEVSKFARTNDSIFTHKQAQLLVIRGTDDDIKFVQSMLAALREKARFENPH